MDLILIVILVLNILFIIVFLLFLNVAFLVQVLHRIVFVGRLLRRAQLVVNVLDLPLHLFIRAFNQVYEHVQHAQRVRLLLQTVTLQDRVQRSVDVGPHLQIFMLHHIRKHFEDIDLRHQLLALVFAPTPQTQIHQEGSCILHRVVRKVVLAGREDLDDPANHSAFDHRCLCCFPQTEFLQRAQCVLAQVGVVCAFTIESLNQHFDDVAKL